MPSSFFAPIAAIIDLVLKQNPQSVLDLGVGFGEYGFLLRERMDIWGERYTPEQWAIRIEGIEGCEFYRTPVHDYIYNTMYYEPIEKKLPKLGRYDVVLLIDVIEHFTKEQGRALIDEILMHVNKALILATPSHVLPQTPYLGNELELHLSQWDIPDFTDYNYDRILIPVDGTGSQVYTLTPIK